MSLFNHLSLLLTVPNFITGNGRQPSPSAPPKGPPPRGPPPRNSIRLGPGPPGGQPPGQYLGRPSFSQSTLSMLYPCSTITYLQFPKARLTISICSDYRTSIHHRKNRPTIGRLSSTISTALQPIPRHYTPNDSDTNKSQ